MQRKRTLLAALAIIVLAAGAVAVGAIAASGNGIADHLSYQTRGRVDTPSSTFINTGSAVTVTPGAPSLLAIRFLANGYEQDFNQGGAFVGKNFAAMLVRVTVDGSPVGRVVRFFDNTGKLGVRKPRPTVSSYEWVGNVTAGSHTVRVQFRNLHTWDSATILSSTLTVLDDD
jgi:hypothetical protein